MRERLSNLQKMSVTENSDKIFSAEYLKKIKDKVPVYMVPLFISVLASCSKEQRTVPYAFRHAPNLNETTADTIISQGFVDLLLSDMASMQDPNEFRKDPSLSIVRKLGYDDKVPETIASLPDIQKAEWVMRTARAMYVMGLEPTAKNFDKTLKDIMEVSTEKEITNKKLFEGRSVALFAHNEEIDYVSENKNGSTKIDSTRDTFGRLDVQNGILRQKPHNFEMFKSQYHSSKHIEKTKDEFRKYVRSHKDLTLVFDAHGLPDGVFLDNYGSDDVTGLDFKSLALDLVTRYKNGFQDTAILIFTSCYSHDFIRNLYHEMDLQMQKEQLDIPLPVAIGTTEYGQVGLGFPALPYGSPFFERILSEQGTTVGDVLKVEAEHSGSGVMQNISVFVPWQITSSKKPKGSYFQIAENDKDKAQKVAETMYAEGVKNGAVDSRTAHLFEVEQPDKAEEIKRALGNKSDRA